MALNPSAEGKRDPECTEAGDQRSERGDGGMNSSSGATSAAAANQNGDQAGCEDSVMPEQEAPDRRKSAQADGLRSSSGSSPLLAAGHRPPGDELLPRRSNYQIPRKTTKGGKGTGMYDFLPPDSRGFEDVNKIITSFYLDQSSRGSFSYYKARLIHNELLEKEFIEKRRAMKQEGRTEAELAESYCFLFPDKARLQWICEKGLSVGNSRNTMLGNPLSGVYLSKFSDLLQINPFEVGSVGDMIIFKVMRGRIKHIYDSMPKNAVEPTQKFDCHVSKSANRVSSLLSYRAFELTQQYFFEFAFEEIKVRPRHVCPYAVVSFKYQGKDHAVSAPLTAHRFNIVPQTNRGKCCYTVWSGPLMNKGQEMFQVCVRSSTRPYLPFKLPERLDLSRGMQLEQAKRKIPAVLFSWDTYSITREVMKCGMFCSLFEVVDGKGKPTNGSLAGLVHKLERDRMVLVQPLFDRGFLFFLTSTQMVNPNERWGRVEKSLQALFIFQESRAVAKYPPPRVFEPEPLSADFQPAIPLYAEPFLPALHYALYKLRPNPGKDLSAGVEHRAHEYLTRLETAAVRPFIVPDYKQNLDERGNNYPAPRAKHNIEGQLRSYVHNPTNYMFSLTKARDMIDKIRNPVPVVHVPVPVPVHVPAHVPAPLAPLPPVEYSPVSDWGGSDMGSDRAAPAAERLQPKEMLLLQPERSSSERLLQPDGGGSSRRSRSHSSHSNGSQAEPQPPVRLPQGEYGPSTARADKEKYDKDKMKELLKLIHQHKKNLGTEPGQEKRPEDGAWDPYSSSSKRKMEADEWGRTSKHPRLDPMSNGLGEPSRVLADEAADEGNQNFNLTSVMESMGIYDTDLRATRGNAQSSSVNETQRLLKILLATLNKVANTGVLTEPSYGESSTGSGRRDPTVPDPDLRKPEELPAATNYVAEDMDCSPASPFSPGSPAETPHTSDNPAWAIPTHQEPVQAVPEPVTSVGDHAEPKPVPVTEVKKVAPVADVKKVTPVTEVKIVSPVPEIRKVAPVAEVKKAAPESVAEVKKAAPAAVAEVKKAAPAPVAEAKKPASPPPRIINIVEEPPQRPSISLDTILNQEVYSLTSDIRSLMQTQHVYYNSQLPQRLPPLRHSWLPNRSFSGFVVPYVTSEPVHGHVNALCEKMGKLLPPPPPHLAAAATAAAPSHMPGSDLTPPNAPVTTTATPKTKAEASQSKSASSSSRKLGAVRDRASAKAKAVAAPTEAVSEVYSPSHVTPNSPEQSAGPAAAPGSTLLANSLIGQLKPEVFSSLVEIFKDVTKNTVKFYIHSEDEGNGSSTICKEIQEYLMSLGNSECNPQAFLENSGSLDKLLIIIQNEDIAAHVHKIPALVSLKKLSSVSFAGVDSLDDVKNHTYNELFVSGGFIVSDEFVLNPDLISQERLQALLRFLEEQCTPEHPWQWKVHCKSQKKLKELARLNSNAMGLLSLLTAYQKKHLVEFLPYHECDTQSRQAPDLDCLIKLQAQHTQQRHLIFLTERPFEMFLQYSRNGIVIASIDDIMTSFHSLIGAIDQNELPTPPSTVNDESVEAEDMSLDSDDGGEPTATADPPAVAEPSELSQGPAAAEQPPQPPQPPPPETEEFRPPLPDQQTTPGSTPKLSTALSTALSQFKAANPMASVASDVGSMSPGGFAVNPHQSFLCPTTSWAPYTAAAAFTASPAYPASPCSVTQEQEYRPPAPASATIPPAPTLLTPAPAPSLLSSVPTPSLLTPAPVPSLQTTAPALLTAPSLLTTAPSLLTTVGPLANLASLPMEVKPPPPPHLMMLGHMYGSDPSGVGVAGAYSTNSGGGTPTQPGDRTHSGPGAAAASGTGACDSSTMQGVALPGAVAHSGLIQAGEMEWSETVGSNTPGSQGARTPVDCSDSLGACVGIPTAATRGGSAVRPNLPTHPLQGGPYGCIGAIPGQMDHGALRGAMGPGSLGGYRGRGVPPGAPWPRPGLGEGPGGGPCSWGYPMGRGRGQDYYTYSHNYSP